MEATPYYSHLEFAGTGPGATIDVTAFTQDSSAQILVSGGASVILEGTLDPNNPDLWMTVGTAYSDGSYWVRVPKEVQFARTNVLEAGLVTSCFGRGISGTSLLSSQRPVLATSGAQ